MLCQMLCDQHGACLLLPHTRMKCAQTAQCEPRIERRSRAANDIAPIFQLFRLCGGTSDDRTASHIGMAVQIFRRGMDGIIRAEFKRALKGRRKKRIVHCDFGAQVLCLFSKTRNIHDAYERVAWCLDQQKRRVLVQRLIDSLLIRLSYEPQAEMPPLCPRLGEAHGSPITIMWRENEVIRPEATEKKIYRGHAA